MKKLLLTAALAALFVPSLAQAQEEQGVKLGIGGYFKGYITYLDQDDDTAEARNVDILRDTEVQFKGETTLDNGMTVGAYIAADADNGGSFNIGDTYAYFSGDWGKVNFGQTDGAAYLLQVAAPSADANFDGMDPFISPFNYNTSAVTQLGTIRDDGLDYDQDVTSPDDKLTYITPMFGGFQAGVSYTPDMGSGSSRAFGNALDDQAGNFGDAWDLGLRYTQDFDGVKASLGGGYTKASLEQANASFGDDRTAWNVGADFDIGAFGVGAVYTQDNFGDRNNTDSDVQQIGFGVDYTTGPYVLGASYFDQNNEFGTNEIDTSRYAAGVTYNFGPGMSFRGVVTHIEHDVDAALGADFDGTAILLGTDITF